MSETVLLHKVAENFGISDPEATKIILGHGNVITKVLINSGEIERFYYDDLVKTGMFFQTLIIPHEDVLQYAYYKVPFDKLPRVYFLLDENVVVYVGQTNEICGRINTHMRDKDFDRVATFIYKENLYMTEAMNILHYNPAYNGMSLNPYSYFSQVVKRTEYLEV